MAIDKDQQLKMLEETQKLFLAALDALSRTAEAQQSVYARQMLSNAGQRLCEASYWLSEALASMAYEEKKPTN